MTQKKNFHIKIINIFPKKPKLSYLQTTHKKPKCFFKQELFKSIKPQQDQTRELCPTCGISSAQHKNSYRELHFQTGRSQDFPSVQAQQSDSDSTSGRMAHLSPKATSCPQGPWLNPLLKGSNPGKPLWGGPRTAGPAVLTPLGNRPGPEGCPPQCRVPLLHPPVGPVPCGEL